VYKYLTTLWWKKEEDDSSSFGFEVLQDLDDLCFDDLKCLNKNE
jgi:hypothetical protein